MTQTRDKISFSGFYGEFHGHRVEDLEVLLPRIRAASESMIWLAGDSSLDNKYWFRDVQPAVGAYRDVLEPPRSVCDVTYWLNYLAAQRGGDGSEGDGGSAVRSHHIATINTAVEATTLNERTTRGLRPQDEFLRDHILNDDVLVVSIGGNDVALAPTPCTIVSMLCLLSLPLSCIENAVSCGAVPFNDTCAGCGPSFVSCACSLPPCLGYFRHLFGVRVESYIRRLTAKRKPRKILVCMIYYPGEEQVPSWANFALGALGYNKNPAKLQAVIRVMFQHATSAIRIPGTEVIPVPLYEVLDGRRTEDYVARVEPSAIGGRKMAEFLWDIIQRPTTAPDAAAGGGTYRAPAASCMEERS